ncbi:MAG: ATP-dependent DNA ligase, partial [Burkholderiaceae bacterium]
FDLLAAGGKSTMALPQAERRIRLERLLGSAAPPLHLTPMTRDAAEAGRWLQQFEGAGLDGVVAKLESAAYQPGKRAMLKIKHVRSADCVVAGFRWYKDCTDAVGSLLLGLYDDTGTLHHVGVTSSFTMAMRQPCWRRWRRCASGRPSRTRGARGPARRSAVRSACPARTAAGAAART